MGGRKDVRKIHIESKEQALDYCLKMNCLACPQNTGSYRNCPYFEQKKATFDKENDHEKAK